MSNYVTRLVINGSRKFNPFLDHSRGVTDFVSKNRFWGLFDAEDAFLDNSGKIDTEKADIRQKFETFYVSRNASS